jgi:hypothetical protein
MSRTFQQSELRSSQRLQILLPENKNCLCTDLDFDQAADSQLRSRYICDVATALSARADSAVARPRATKPACQPNVAGRRKSGFVDMLGLRRGAVDALLYRVADNLLVLAASGARLVLAVAGSKARGTEHRGTDALALRIITRTTGKTSIRRRIGVAPANVAGLCGRRPNQHDQKHSTQDPLQHQPPRLPCVSQHFAHYFVLARPGS